MVVTTLAFLQI